jgi:hypothetical protein
MLLTYRLIAAALVLLLAASLLKKRPFGEQVTAGMVMIPLILRVLLIK